MTKILFEIQIIKQKVGIPQEEMESELIKTQEELSYKSLTKGL